MTDVYVCNLCPFKTTDEDTILKHVLKEHTVETMLAVKGKFTMNPEKK